MTKVCKRHANNPVKIYHQCVGRELEWFREELEQKQQEIEQFLLAMDRARAGAIQKRGAAYMGVPAD